MRISVSGSHSTGKTCLAKLLYRKLSQEYPNQVTLIDEVARRLRRQGLPLNQEATLGTYISYIYEQLKAERVCTTMYVVSDRSLVDLLAYILANANPRIPKKLDFMVEEIIFRETNYFDLYVYSPIEFSLVLDDVRPADIEYQELVDEKIRYVLHTLDAPVLRVSGPVQRRVNRVIKEIHKRRCTDEDSP